jgi:enoyl-CoA hydratase/carnithine racemase
MPPAKLGLIYGHTGLQRFIEVVGVARTKELFLLGRTVDESHAAAIGLVNQVVAPAQLEATAVELAAEIAGNAPVAVRGNKHAIETLARHPVLTPEQERELVELRESCFASEDFREGIRAFAERRPPVWRGR